MTQDMTASAPLSSMTGFARKEGGVDGLSWVWEARSVNGKSLDLRLRTPAGFERLESVARVELAKRFRRGNVTLNLSLGRSETAPALRINREVLDQLVALARELNGETAPIRVDTLLGIRGVVETGDTASAELNSAVEAEAAAAIAPLLDDLQAARLEEGGRLRDVLAAQIDHIAGLVGDARASAAAQPDALKARLKAQLDLLLEARPPLPEDRLAQELALLVGRCDVREELDRLDAHIGQARGLLAAGSGVGRRLDFLCQEFNREANTLCSKAADVALTRIGLDLKAVIEQFREQIQNIE
ncbi:YicC/YloC family endoribonuclease [Inquilinus limosus]|uniref:YicC/YloC family endoribonuclease n=1 Tax=Inquilinus limosus TaxID=171674 RepID=UPI0004134262|nr:YicC/YloC family endoribonuclease [Inquilinus limosus]